MRTCVYDHVVNTDVLYIYKGICKNISTMQFIVIATIITITVIIIVIIAVTILGIIIIIIIIILLDVTSWNSHLIKQISWILQMHELSLITHIFILFFKRVHIHIVCVMSG